MDIHEILSKVDHTLLTVDATTDDIKALCDDAIKYKTASVCIPPRFVKFAKEYVGDSMKVCTVIGFPNGYATTKAKVFETKDAIDQGADEIDMVVSIGDIKSGHYDLVLDEIRSIKNVCGAHVLKVIIETAMLTQGEKISMCKVVTDSGADYIKTSTGFSTGGATFEDVELFTEHIGPGVHIKAAGGIASLEDAVRFIELGAERLGTSRIVKLAKTLEA